MANNNIGDQIRDAVQDAINSQDFSKLNETVTNSIGMAAQNIQKGMEKGLGKAAENVSKRKTFNDQWINQPYEGKYQISRENLKIPPGRYISAGSIKAVGYIMAIMGGVFSLAFLVGILTTAIFAFIPGSEVAVGLITELIFLLVSAGVCVAGVKRIGLAGRFQRYIRIIGERGYCDIKELAQRSGSSAKFVIKQIKTMLHKGWFYQGQLDDSESCLMVTNEAYKQYETTRKQLEMRRREEQILQSKGGSKKQTEDISPETQAVLEEGNAYIRKIRECNDAIPGEVISAKISRIELIVQKIFQRVKEHPEVIGDLKQLMSYYLPTTIKLLEAYEDLDKQPVQGENITISKREIEDTLDTLNTAFEKLLDSIFKDVAWDVSSDISVLHTILAQEGLTENVFDKKEKIL